MQVFSLERGQSIGYKGEGGTSNAIGVATAETSPRAYSLMWDHLSREWIWWLEAYKVGNQIHSDYELKLSIDNAPGFESYSDQGRINVVGFAPFKHDGQLKAQVLHYRGERPSGSGRNDDRRDQYTYRSGLYLVDVPG